LCVEKKVLYGLVEPRWVFPNRWYDFVVQDPAGFSIHFVVIDTMSIIENIHDPAAQLQWLNETLVASTSEWRVVVAHHPPYTTGKHGPINEPIDEQVTTN
jgi:tartrate-resistant acid phosphatase type 5